MSHLFSRTGLVVFAAVAFLSGCAQEWPSQPLTAEDTAAQPVVETPAPPPADVVEKKEERQFPSLIVTNEPAPDIVYRRGSGDRRLEDLEKNTAVNIPAFDTSHIETLVTRKAMALSHDLGELQGDVESSNQRMQQMQAVNDARAAEYYALVASISTDLQAGTTPGNPVLVDQWNVAQERLNALAQSSGLLNGLATDLTNQASRASYLLDATQTAFSLSGAVKEDHKKLTVVEDGVNQTITFINRLLVKTNDEISRRTAYLRTERANLQALSLGIANGELYGQSLTNSLFRKATGDGQSLFKPEPVTSADSPAAAKPAERRPLVIIRFDRPDVNYDQPVYTAISQALDKYPTARFDLVAVSNTAGNPAQMALTAVEARKNGEAVLRSLMQMGLPVERIRLNTASSKDVLNSEVHIYLQ